MLPKSKPESMQKTLKMTKNRKNRVFSYKIGHFHSLISEANIYQNIPCHKVLELTECEQQYSGQFVVIYSTRQKLLIKKPNRGTWHKNWSFSEHYFEQLELFDWKTIYTIKNMKLSEHFCILHSSRRAIWIIPKNRRKKATKNSILAIFLQRSVYSFFNTCTSLI